MLSIRVTSVPKLYGDTPSIGSSCLMILSGELLFVPENPKHLTLLQFSLINICFGCSTDHASQKSGLKIWIEVKGLVI